jgi:hypothetical protein
LTEPIGAAESGKLLFELIRKGQKMRRVVDGIVEHLGRERADGPVGLLGGFCKDEPEVMVEQGREAKLAEPDETCCDPGIKDIFGINPACFTQQTKVVVTSVDNDGFSLENGKKGREVEGGERVYEKMRLRARDLDETKLLKVAVQRIGFGIECDSGVASEVVAEGEKGRLFSDHFRVNCRGVRN